MSQDVKIARWVATIAGLIGFVLSVATPLLPVVQTTATLNWPQNGQLNNVTAPLISQVPVTMTVTVPCDVIRSMPPAGRDGARDSAEERQAGGPAVAVRQRQQPARRHHRPQRRGRQRAAGRGSLPPDVSASRSPRSEAGTFATFVGLTDPTTGKEQRTGFADPNLRPSIVGIFTDLTGPAPPGLSAVCRHRHPVLHQANGFEAGRDGAGHRRDHRRAGRAVAAGPARRPPDAAVDSRALAYLLRHRRRRHRRLPGVACHRRQLLRRRLHPADGPRRRARRLHVELLPLVRQSRGPVRLVLQPAGADDPRQRCEHLDAAAGPGVWDRVLAPAVSRSAAPARARGR